MNNSDGRPALIRFEFAELETFLAVVREGSFSLAARQLHVSQPSVTNRVKRLEETLRVKLLVRTTRKVEPTQDGVLLRDAAEQAMSGLREVVKRFQLSSEQERNRVVVAATPMVAATVMPQVISSYRARYPDVQVLLRDLPYEKVIKSIVDGEAEIGIAALDGAQNTLRFQLLAEEPMLLVVPTRHPLTEAAEVTLDIATGYPMMFLERYTALRARLALEYAQRGIAFEPGTASTLPTLLGMIDAGNCITFLPRSMAQSNAKKTRTTLEVVDFKASRRYGSVVARNGSLGTAAQSFHLHLRKVFETTLNANA